jgi:hypothetical protein
VFGAQHQLRATEIAGDFLGQSSAVGNLNIVVGQDLPRFLLLFFIDTRISHRTNVAIAALTFLKGEILGSDGSSPMIIRRFGIAGAFDQNSNTLGAGRKVA